MSALIMSRRDTLGNGRERVVPRLSQFRDITRHSFRRQANFDMLCSELEINSLLPIFSRNDVITNEELEIIKRQKHRRRRVAEFLETMFKREGDEWIDQVLHVLQRHNHGHIVRRLQGRIESPRPYQIRVLRPTTVEQRIWLNNGDLENAIERNENSQILEDAKSAMEFSILSIYNGSICFLLDPMSENAIDELWKKNKNIQKIKKFIRKILARFKLHESLQQKRRIKVEITEKPNDFIIRIKDQRTPDDIYMVTSIKPNACSGCFRQTVFDNYQTILDEIETNMMEDTFKEGSVPGCIKTACIDEKDKRSRLERADIFLQFILTNEGFLMAFKQILNDSSAISLKQFFCTEHEGQTVRPLKMREPIILHFEIWYDKYEDVVVVNFISDELRKSWPSLDADAMPRYIEGLSAAKMPLEGENEIRVVIIGNDDLQKRLIANLFMEDVHYSSTAFILERKRFYDSFSRKTFVVTTVPEHFSMDPSKYEIAKCIAMTSPGPHVVLAVAYSVIHCDEFLRPFVDLFGESFKMFTALAVEKIHQSSLVSTKPILFYDKHDRSMLVTNILKFVHENTKRTGMTYFSNPVYEKTEKMLKQNSQSYYENQLQQYRQQETDIAYHKAEIVALKSKQRSIQESDLRDTMIKNLDENAISRMSREISDMIRSMQKL